MQTKQTNRKALEYYLKLCYPITIYLEPEGGYVAPIKALPGCITQGETPDEMMADIEEAQQLWIETVYEQGNEISLPSDNFLSGYIGAEEAVLSVKQTLYNYGTTSVQTALLIVLKILNWE